MEENKLAVAILGVVVIVAIICLVFMFSVVKTGEAVYGPIYGSYVVPKIYTNYNQNPWPYSRVLDPTTAYERPATTMSGEEPAGTTYGGASEFFMTGTPKGVQSTFVTYKRSAETSIPTAQTTGIAIRFPGGIKADHCYGRQQYYTKSADPTRHCFTEDAYGRAISSYMPQFYGCCDS